MKRIEFCADLRAKLKASGYNGEYRDSKGVFTWIPRSDQTPKQITEAEKIISAWDETAQKEWRKQNPKDPNARKITAILNAINGASSLSALKVAIGLIED